MILSDETSEIVFSMMELKAKQIIKEEK